MTGYTALLAVADPVALQLFPEEGREAITVVVALAFLLGLGAIYAGIRTKRRADRVSGESVTEPGAVTDGTVAIEGTARPADELAEHPTGDGEVIAHETKTRVVETRWDDDDGSTDPSDGPKQQDQNVRRSTSSDVVPFYLEGETGTVLVDAGDDVRLELTGTESITGDPESPDREDILERQVHKRISLLEDGDDVFVFGRARAGEVEQADAVVGPDDELDELIVATKDYDAVVEQYSSNVPVALALGTVTAVASLGLLVYEYVLA